MVLSKQMLEMITDDSYHRKYLHNQQTPINPFKVRLFYFRLIYVCYYFTFIHVYFRYTDIYNALLTTENT